MKLSIKIPLVKYPERLKFVLQHVFEQLAGFDLTYSVSENLGGSIQLHWSGGSSMNLPLDVIWLNEGVNDSLPTYWDLQPQSPDYWRALFFFLSNQQESVYHHYDQHGRWIAPPPDQFWIPRDKPFIDIAITDLFRYINDHTAQDLCFIQSTYQPVLSVDVDQWFAYSRKSWSRLLIGWMRDIRDARWKRVGERYQVTLKSAEDPYDTYQWLGALARERMIKSEVFVSATTRSVFDKQFEIPKDLILDKIKHFDEVGLHPSYHVHEKDDLFKNELEIVENWLTKSMTSSRFHYLRGNWDKRNQMLIKHNILQDKTFSLIQEVGFPNGTCHPFYYYNFEKEKTTDLLVTPQIAMDVTLKDQLGLNGNDALTIMNPIIQECKKYKGIASIIWHNSSFDPTEDWGDYRKVFPALLDMMRQ